MSLFKPIAWLILFIFSTTPAWAADESTCCAALRQEVQMIKDQLKNQQASVSKELSQQQATSKIGFKGVGALIDALSIQFPNLPGLKKIKAMFDELNK
jgi:hypothetical protein